MRLALQSIVPALRAAGVPEMKLAAGVEAQETTYLLQRAGARLGYHFGWEAMGPFSTELAETLNDASTSVVQHFAAAAVEPDVSQAAEKVRDLRQRRPQQDISEQRWLRLVACIDFLRDMGVSLDTSAIPPFVRNTYDRDVIRAAAESIDDVLGSSSEATTA